jgi:hypothetical protein
MSPSRPISDSISVLVNTYACVIQMACSMSACSYSLTCGKPMMNMRVSIPTINTPMVVTVKANNFYSKKKPLQKNGDKPQNNLC